MSVSRRVHWFTSLLANQRYNLSSRAQYKRTLATATAATTTTPLKTPLPPFTSIICYRFPPHDLHAVPPTAPPFRFLIKTILLGATPPPAVNDFTIAGDTQLNALAAQMKRKYPTIQSIRLLHGDKELPLITQLDALMEHAPLYLECTVAATSSAPTVYSITFNGGDRLRDGVPGFLAQYWYYIPLGLCVIGCFASIIWEERPKTDGDMFHPFDDTDKLRSRTPTAATSTLTSSTSSTTNIETVTTTTNNNTNHNS